ncbi:gamma-glutamylcyclotransferase [Burkholderia sp. Bp9140]|nr:gamma-glutamylcyclotransferase [Burkholderia sp. Bp9140]
MHIVNASAVVTVKRGSARGGRRDIRDGDATHGVRYAHPLFRSRQKSIVRRRLSALRRATYSRVTATKGACLRFMSDDRPIPDADYEMTRKHLARGTLLRALRADPPVGMTLRSDAELERTLRMTLERHEHGRDFHLFGYGSLMWNPALDVAGSSVARIDGWHRAFCLRLVVARGTPEQPGAMLALDRGGMCDGMLYRIEAAKVEAELRLLWRREMLADSYEPQWLATTVDGRPIRALTFVVNRSHDRYLGDYPVEHIAQLIRSGRGPLGTSRAYFESTVQALARLGIHDAGIARLARSIRDADDADAVA